jgi:hypothetical protein
MSFEPEHARQDVVNQRAHSGQDHAVIERRNLLQPDTAN